MLKQDAIRFFGGVTKVAHAAGVKPPTVSDWGDVIPEGRAHRLAEASGGAVPAWTKEQYDSYRQSKRSGGQNTVTIKGKSD